MRGDARAVRIVPWPDWVVRIAGPRPLCPLEYPDWHARCASIFEARTGIRVEVVAEGPVYETPGGTAERGVS